MYLLFSCYMYNRPSGLSDPLVAGLTDCLAQIDIYMYTATVYNFPMYMYIEIDVYANEISFWIHVPVHFVC
jgi:hypothetical protein